jgi:hypothetical protein
MRAKCSGLHAYHHRHQFEIIHVVCLFFAAVLCGCVAPTQQDTKKGAVADVEIMLIMKCTFASEETVECKKGENEEDGIAPPFLSVHRILLSSNNTCFFTTGSYLRKASLLHNAHKRDRTEDKKSVGERPEGENRDNSARRQCRGGRSRSFLVASSLAHV